MRREESLTWKPSVEKITSPKAPEINEEKRQMLSRKFGMSHYTAIVINFVFFGFDVMGLVISAEKSTFIPFEITGILDFAIFMVVLYRVNPVLTKLWNSGNTNGVRNYLIALSCWPIIPMLYEFYLMPTFAQFFALSLLASYTFGVAISGLLVIWRSSK